MVQENGASKRRIQAGYLSAKASEEVRRFEAALYSALL